MKIISILDDKIEEKYIEGKRIAVIFLNTWLPNKFSILVNEPLEILKGVLEKSDVQYYEYLESSDDRCFVVTWDEDKEDVQ